MIKLRTPIQTEDDYFREIEYDNQVIGSIYQYQNYPIIYQCLVPALEFYKKKYKTYGEQDGYMFIGFNTLRELLRFKGIKDEI